MKKTMKAVAALMLTVTVVCVTGCGSSNGNQRMVESAADKPQNLNGHNYVDLGLPNGTLWATCNVGADSPESYGDYFAWGETQPKSSYFEKNYKHAYYETEFEVPVYIKYTLGSHYLQGESTEPDNLTVLEAVDDAATSNWGNGWHTPTTDEWNELLANCTREWTTRNHVKGMLFTGKNGNNIFLPAGGVYYEMDTPKADKFGNYLTSSLYRDRNDRSSYCYVFSRLDEGDLSGSDRFIGGSVRPVCSGTQR